MNPNEQGSTSLTKGKLLRVQTVPPCNLGKGHCAGLALFFSPLGPMCHGQCLRRLSAPDCITWAPLPIDLGSAPGRPRRRVNWQKERWDLYCCSLPAWGCTSGWGCSCPHRHLPLGRRLELQGLQDSVSSISFWALGSRKGTGFLLLPVPRSNIFHCSP